eukprot:TRINITY_DN67290_c8_g6_i1.p1 TRINITY_DN67290_c8_g6~~TRINITY_DN67290_c8_g6_i1.p1  ORF type:complete len:526 (-),score=244.98 TRINITY_DN67290_c8_g6_i1:143-1696(-)
MATLNTKLLSAQQIMTDALKVSFRRNKRFKTKVQQVGADIKSSVTLLSSSLALASVEDEAAGIFPALPDRRQVLNGEQECLLGDKCAVGHGCPQSWADAVVHYENAARQDYPPALTSLGLCFLDGKGVVKDVNRAHELFQKAADAGDLNAVHQLGIMYQEGVPGSLTIRKDVDKAIALFEKAAKGGHYEAMNSLGFLYQHGDGPILADIEMAFDFYSKAAQMGFAKAQNNLGFLYFTGALDAQRRPDYFQAFSWFSKASARGNTSALYNMGVCYESGHGVDLNEELALRCYEQAVDMQHTNAMASAGYILLRRHEFARAAELLRRASERGSGDALFHLGQMYEHGMGVVSSDDTAFQYYQKASERGHVRAHVKVADCLFSGHGAPIDRVAAFRHYVHGAKAGIAEAENCVGIMLEEGLGTNRSVQEARTWYERAAERGFPAAIYNLGVLFENGKGVDVDVPKAFELYKRAALLGNVQAKMRLAQQEMSEQVSQAVNKTPVRRPPSDPISVLGDDRLS